MVPSIKPLLLLSCYLLSDALAAPTASLLEARQNQQVEEDSPAWDAGAVTSYPIHSSCNTTQARLIELGLDEAIMLAAHAKEHVLRWGNSSDIYRKYFGNQAPFEVVGAYDMIVSGDKNGTLFRCDDPDENCSLDGWAGHWRGENATGETVICDLSYESRRYLSQMCMLGYTVADSPTNVFWASDLMHRLYHLPAVSAGYIDHFGEDHAELLEYAEANSPNATRDSDGLQYFALEAYAYDIAVPGEGCPGGNSTSETPTSAEPASTTSAAPSECHTHDDGEVHCT